MSDEYRRRTVGIVGAGQLARMMIQAVIPLDIRVVLLAAKADDGAAQVCADVIVGDPDDLRALKSLAEQCDVITFDHELVSPDHLATLEAAGHIIYPSSASMALAQNKRRQRSELRALGVPMPRSSEPGSLENLTRFGDETGWPMVVKASRGGYDGRGVWIVTDASDASEVWDEAAGHGIELVAEEFLAIDREFAMLLARRPDGTVKLYTPIETIQREGICRELRIPAGLSESQERQATEMALKIAEHIDIVGILAIEMFLVNGEVLFNELAPRPHNSGHWTIEGASTSQFEQHLRAVLDLPLGDTSLTAPAIVTTNVLGRGDGADPRALLPAGLEIPGAHIHLYGKEPKAGRKVGHITARDTTLDAARARTEAVLAAVGGKTE